MGLTGDFNGRSDNLIEFGDFMGIKWLPSCHGLPRGIRKGARGRLALGRGLGETDQQMVQQTTTHWILNVLCGS